MRGEYGGMSDLQIASRELPPRARRILAPGLRQTLLSGTTSACAENTDWLGCAQSSPGNYLRVRGEYPHSWSRITRHKELPPRARRIQCRAARLLSGFRTTSACAENTGKISAHTRKPRNYLRVRGEYRHFAWAQGIFRELPPRARRIPDQAVHRGVHTGTTSACAENTLNELGLL